MLPIGNSVAPVSEAEVRPLLKLTELEQRTRAWFAAVDKAEGNQPTAADVQEVVFEILHPEGASEKPATRAQHRAELVRRLKKNHLPAQILGTGGCIDRGTGRIVVSPWNHQYASKVKS